MTENKMFKLKGDRGSLQESNITNKYRDKYKTR